MNHSKHQRWWLPGPPPPRRRIPLEVVEDLYREEGIPELSVPVRVLNFPWNNGWSEGIPYLDHLDEPASDTGTSGSRPTYLFHGCGNIGGSDVVQSFARWGPSIRFSRSRSFFCGSQAVYWSNSVKFAILWSFFSETGRWTLDEFDATQPFHCLIFVSRLDLMGTGFTGGLYLIPKPQTVGEEQELSEWCDGNMNDATRMRIPPPKSQKKDWGMIGSRVPQDTMHSLRTLPHKADETWLFAACNEASSRAVAEAGIEILHITFNPRTSNGMKL